MQTFIPFSVQFHHSADKFPELLFPLISPVQIPSCLPFKVAVSFEESSPDAFQSFHKPLEKPRFTPPFADKVTTALQRYFLLLALRPLLLRHVQDAVIRLPST